VTQCETYFVARTPNELSIVAPEGHVPVGTTAVRGYSCIQVKGPLDFALTGVLASLSLPLAEAGVPIFALSTWETDYILVSHDRLQDAVTALQAAGHRFI
jgi:hypothetical protein